MGATVHTYVCTINVAVALMSDDLMQGFLNSALLKVLHGTAYNFENNLLLKNINKKNSAYRFFVVFFCFCDQYFRDFL